MSSLAVHPELRQPGLNIPAETQTRNPFAHATGEQKELLALRLPTLREGG